jgi:hypothetical protein
MEEVRTAANVRSVSAQLSRETTSMMHQENKFASAVYLLTSGCVAYLFLFSLSAESIHPSGSSTYNIIILMPMLRQDEKVIFAGIHMVGFKGRASVHLHQSGRVWLLTNSNPRRSFHCV